MVMASDLIKELQRAIDENGDLEVRKCDYMCPEFLTSMQGHVKLVIGKMHCGNLITINNLTNKHGSGHTMYHEPTHSNIMAGESVAAFSVS